MILNNLFNNKNNVILKKLLDLSAKNHKVIANNIANAETPGFTAKKLDFEKEFKDAVKSKDMQRVMSVNPRIIKNYEYPYRMDMNNVDIEKEMYRFSQNKIRYEFVGTLLKKKLTFWKNIIEGIK